MTPTTAALEGLHSIPLAQIQPSPENPRKNFEPKPLAELAESIKIHGVRQPVLVRPIGKPTKDSGMRYQLVVGERRWRASKIAGKEDIPAIVDSKLTDSEALEIMVIENLQREDVHALDEALGYELLMKKAAEVDRELGDLPGPPRHSAESIAAKVGKSVGYVYARLKLLALVPAAREAFQLNRITAGHAVLIARLQPLDQLKALLYCLTGYPDADSLKKIDPRMARFADVADDLDPALRPEKALREWIQDNVNLRLKDVPWKLDDANLVPAAGACANCEKRSASNPALFAELAVKGEDTCFDAVCYGKKREAFVKIQIKEDKRVQSVRGEDAEPIRQISEQTAYTVPKADQRVLKAGQWLPAKAKECNSVEDALLVNGENAGQRRLVCCNGACKVHKHHLQKPSEPGATSTAREADAEERKAKSLIDDQVVIGVLRAVTKNMKSPESRSLRFLVERIVGGYYDGSWDLVASGLGLAFKPDDREDNSLKALKAYAAKAKGPSLFTLLGLLIVASDLTVWSPELKNTAKFAGVDIAKLRKQLEKDAKREKAKAAPAK